MTTPQAPAGSLEQRLADLEAGYRALMTANWTERASVVDAQGRAVRLSALAFGMTGWTWTAQQIANGASDSRYQGSAVANMDTGWVPAAYNGSPNINPQADVFVSGGRLRVDWATRIALRGRIAEGGMSYVLSGGVERQDQLNTAPVVHGADTMRAVMLYSDDRDGAFASVAGSSFELETGLTPGWYRVSARFRVATGTDSVLTPWGYFAAPRFALTPY